MNDEQAHEEQEAVKEQADEANAPTTSDQGDGATSEPKDGLGEEAE